MKQTQYCKKKSVLNTQPAGHSKFNKSKPFCLTRRKSASLLTDTE